MESQRSYHSRQTHGGTQSLQEGIALSLMSPMVLVPLFRRSLQLESLCAVGNFPQRFQLCSRSLSWC